MNKKFLERICKKHFKKVQRVNLKIQTLKLDINKSLETKGTIAYKTVVNNEIVGGAIVVIDELTQHNHLDFLYVKYGIQGKGVGKFI